ncbi:hypothetical protein [Kordia antarctica]|nr:hypothetical protein [Kordia antarctica]
MYPVNAWPIIISETTANELQTLSIKLPKLIQQIPKLYFNNDVKKIADYYFSGNEFIAQYAMISHEKKIDIGSRLDLMYTEDGFKVLEINIGSSIGGWQVQSFEKVIRKFHPYLSNQENSNYFHSEDSQKNYVKFLIDKTLQHVKSIENEVNIFINFGQDQHEEIDAKSLLFFNELLDVEFKKRGLTGMACSGKLSSLKLRNGNLYLGNTKIHSVILLVSDDEEVPVDVFRSFLMDATYFPDHVGVTMYGDKRNLGLLRTLAEKSKFSEEDNELILDSIPWTAEIKKRDIIYKKETFDLIDFLRNHKDLMVIKSARGYQGKDVFIGKYVTNEEWEEAIQIGLQETDFIAQEFSDSINFKAPNKNNEWTSHKLVWGSFGFGNMYGGVWVRMSEVESNLGVINSATGAVEAIVYELREEDFYII